MTTDRDLLVLAAKAAGLDYTIDNYAAPGEFDEGWGMVAGIGKFWNPLVNIGQSAELAVSLRIAPTYTPDGKSVFSGYRKVVPRGGRSYSDPIHERLDPDPCAAWCRAVLRRAASIGEDMP